MLRKFIAGGLFVAVSLGPTASGQPNPSEPLTRYAWTQRLLLVAADREDRADVRAVADVLSRGGCELADRDLVVGWLIRHGRSRLGAEPLPPDEALQLRRRLEIEDRDFAVVLIGKDGGVKARYTDMPELTQILALIDGMPMRRSEQRSKARAACSSTAGDP